MSLKNSSVVQENGYYIFECPHCEGIIMVAVNEVNCTIFRHCVLKSNLEQINPHASREQCEELFSKKLVYGCCMPFKLNISPDGPAQAEKCGWI